MYPVHYILDDPQPVVLALDPVDSLLLSQVMTDVVEVAVEKNLPFPLNFNHHLPLFIFFGSHIIQLALWKHINERSGIPKWNAHRLLPLLESDHFMMRNDGAAADRVKP